MKSIIALGYRHWVSPFKKQGFRDRVTGGGGHARVADEGATLNELVNLQRDAGQVVHPALRDAVVPVVPLPALLPVCERDPCDSAIQRLGDSLGQNL
eukprot:7977203-Pyramimonas_sp.AAC.1